MAAFCFVRCVCVSMYVGSCVCIDVHRYVCTCKVRPEDSLWYLPTVLFIKSLSALDLFKETLQVDQKAPGLCVPVKLQH